MLDENDREAARWAAAFADASRLRVVRALLGGPLNVGAVARAIGVPLVNASHHLRILRDAGLVTSAPAGREVFYQLDKKSVRVRNGAVAATGPGGVTVTIPTGEAQSATG